LACQAIVVNNLNSLNRHEFLDAHEMHNGASFSTLLWKHPF